MVAAQAAEPVPNEAGPAQPMFAEDGVGLSLPAVTLSRPSGQLYESYASRLGSEGQLFVMSSQTESPYSLLAPAAHQWIAGVDDARDANAVHSAAREVAIGYAWRHFKLEGAALTVGRDDSPGGLKRDLGLLDSTSSRLSYRLGDAWTFQLSRGFVSNLDQLETVDGLRRTAISGSYRAKLGDGDWRTTLAWGRNDRTTTGASVGYLLESTLRFAGTHAVFGRLERARSREDGLATENVQRQMFQTNRLSLGYYRDLSGSNAFRYDVGAIVTRYLNTPSANPDYAHDATAGMMFVRIWLP
ncbi:hypothetical protein E4K72_04840 [Oxalobacteraceae bacterium OM1]|nr:hypothetical protein E4K72_04840 [Oxalobacteraceae bacterium OM1]